MFEVRLQLPTSSIEPAEAHGISYDIHSGFRAREPRVGRKYVLCSAIYSDTASLRLLAQLLFIMSLIAQVDATSSEFLNGAVRSQRTGLFGIPAMTPEGELMIHEPSSRLCRNSRLD